MKNGESLKLLKGLQVVIDTTIQKADAAQTPTEAMVILLRGLFALAGDGIAAAVREEEAERES